MLQIIYRNCTQCTQLHPPEDKSCWCGRLTPFTMMMMVIGGDKDNNDDDGDDKARYLLRPRAAWGWWQITEEYGHHRNFRPLTVVSPLCCLKRPFFPMICYALFWQPPSLPTVQLFLALAGRGG